LGPPLSGHTAAVVSVAFSPDGQTLASGSRDNTIILWDTSTVLSAGVASGGTSGQRLAGHSDVVWSVAFSPDGQTLASSSCGELSVYEGCRQGEIRLWDVATGRLIGQPLAGHTDVVWSVAFSPDGQSLASGSDDTTIMLWDVSLESWQARACSIANRNLTRAEWRQYLGDEPYRETCPES
ncbi:MAG: WD40 repeat domain-containing protein, partial [Anaerolineae bacterium]